MDRNRDLDRSRRRGLARRIFVRIERGVLSFGMSAVAFFVEKRLIRAMKKGEVEPAPRTAAEDEILGEHLGVNPVAEPASASDERPGG